MFEKEATERTKEMYNFQSFITREQGKELWRDGAEFGYNKAKEWHYVKDGNPNNENDILCQISKDEVVVGYYHIKKKRYITIDGQDLYDVIAWKEIVLPKESK